MEVLAPLHSNKNQTAKSQSINHFILIINWSIKHENPSSFHLNYAILRESLPNRRIGLSIRRCCCIQLSPLLIVPFFLRRRRYQLLNIWYVVCGGRLMVRWKYIQRTLTFRLQLSLWADGERTRRV